MTPNLPDPDDEPRKGKTPPKSPFDEFFNALGLKPDDFDRLFDQMQRALQEAMRNMGGLEPGKPYVHGFTFKIGPDGKPQVSEFGNRPQRPATGARPLVSPEREPITDVIEEGNQVAITVELPGVDKKDIDIRVTETELGIHVDTAARKYAKSVKLGARVKPETTKATFKNGVLDVTIQKEKPGPSRSGHKVKVE